jgi:hypothetical protein
MKIKKWLICPRGFEDNETTEEILKGAGRSLDQAYSHDIVGECIFEGEDGKMYVGTVEFVISEANPDYVKDLMDADAVLSKEPDFSGFEKGLKGDQEI